MNSIRTHLRLGGRRNEGFTLIELLVICVILGILAIMLFANLRRAIWKAREGRTFEGLHSLRTALQMFNAQKGPEYSYNPGGNATDGYPWNFKEGTWGPVPPPYGQDYLMEDNRMGWGIEHGGYSAGMNTYLSVTPPALIGRNGDPHTDDGYYNEGDGGTAGWIVNYDAASTPNINGSWRGWYYRNTDGKIWINNNSVSTDGTLYYNY